MPIDRGPWSALIDDDGSNLVGTVWNKDKIKTVLLDPIDLLVGGLPLTYGAWVPVDQSGAGLAFNVTTAAYAKLGRLVFVWVHLQYPVTSAVQPAIISALPFLNGAGFGGFYHTYSAKDIAYQIPPNSNFFYLLNPVSGAQYTNANLSAATIIFNGVYLTA